MNEPAPTPSPAASQAGERDFLLDLGLLTGLAGLFGHWHGTTGLIHGVLIWAVLRALVLRGWGAVRHGGPVCGLVLPGGLVAFGLLGVLGISLGGLLGSTPEGAGLAFGPVISLVGGALALFGAFRLHRALPGENSGDPQFSGSLSAYLAVLIGLLLPWTVGGASGSENWMGSLTLACVILAMTASWVGTWKLWSMKAVTGHLGMVLFLAPLWGVFYGLLGVVRLFMQKPLMGLWPATGEESFFIHGGGPVLVTCGSMFAVWVLIRGAKSAMESEKVRREEERAARKAHREASRSDS